MAFYSLNTPFRKQTFARGSERKPIMCHFRLWSVVAAGLLGAAGCVHQEKDVAAYRAVLDGHAPTTARPVAQPFAAGTTLTLAEALALASRDHERLAMQGEEYVQSLIDKDRAFSTFLPQCP
jgi:hypothetical protein